MWLLFARALPPDVPVWRGRRALALIDAVAWPVALAAVVHAAPFAGGIASLCVVALCAVAALRRGFRAVACNHRYHFTTWRWGCRVALVVGFGLALRLAAALGG